jgi:dipeptidyl aminopeptidase/acylaminoacyl peptidase
MSPRSLATASLLAAVAALLSCGPTVRRAASGPTEPSLVPHLVAMERTTTGAQLVILDENGDRLADLTGPAEEPARDNSPVWSPDGRWIVFASTRGRGDLVRTSLWGIEARLGAEPFRLTGPGAERAVAGADAAAAATVVDRDPVWAPSGDAVIFASSRGGSFDLYRLGVAAGQGRLEPRGAPERLTSAPTHELHPTAGPDGSIVYMAVAADGDASRLWRLPVGGGEPTPLTEGPGDVTPAWSPDGKQIAFAALAPTQDATDADADLWMIDADGGNRHRVVDEVGDQTGPVWSRDGRFLFATSLFRSIETGKPILASVVVVDLRDKAPVLRALHESAGPVQRTGPAVGTAALDVARLTGNRGYLDAVKEAIRQYKGRLESDAVGARGGDSGTP